MQRITSHPRRNASNGYTLTLNDDIRADHNKPVARSRRKDIKILAVRTHAITRLHTGNDTPGYHAASASSIRVNHVLCTHNTHLK